MHELDSTKAEAAGPDVRRLGAAHNTWPTSLILINGFKSKGLCFLCTPRDIDDGWGVMDGSAGMHARMMERMHAWIAPSGS